MTLPLDPYQEHAAQWMAPRLRAGCFDEPGLGKTAQAIRVLDMRAADRAIVICPAAARDNWIGEFRKFSLRHRKIVKGRDIHDFTAWRKGRFDTLVTSFEKASDWSRHVVEAAELVECVVIDEGHYLKNPDSGRAKAILGADSTGAGGMVQWAISAYWLTGTPQPNDPQDIYTFLRFAGVMPLRRRGFIDRYFKTRATTYSERHEVVPGAPLNELRTLIGNNSIYRTFDSLGMQLPPLRCTTYLIEGDTQPIRELLMMHPGMDQAIIEHLENGRPLSALEADYVATLRRLLGEAKAVPYAQLLGWELLHGGLDKMVVMGIHTVALERVAEALTNIGIPNALLYGKTPEPQRQPIVNRFQSDPALRVLVCNHRTAGVSLTMTASHRVDVFESPWSPGDTDQLIKRVHRRTQTRPVLARFMTLANSFDETVNEIVARKAGAIAAVRNDAATAATAAQESLLT